MCENFTKPKRKKKTETEQTPDWPCGKAAGTTDAQTTVYIYIGCVASLARSYLKPMNSVSHD